jgi:hypothetical protein
MAVCICGVQCDLPVCAYNETMRSRPRHIMSFLCVGNSHELPSSCFKLCESSLLTTVTLLQNIRSCSWGPASPPPPPPAMCTTERIKVSQRDRGSHCRQGALITSLRGLPRDGSCPQNSTGQKEHRPHKFSFYRSHVFSKVKSKKLI